MRFHPGSYLEGRTLGLNICKLMAKDAADVVCLRHAEPVFHGDNTCVNAQNKINIELRIFNQAYCDANRKKANATSCESKRRLLTD